MDFFTRASNGWNIAKNSFKVLEANKQLIVFPLLSGVSIILILGSFVTAILGASNWDIDNINETSTVAGYTYLFLFYLVNYFVVVFFNTALTFCTGEYYKGNEVSVKKGIAYSISHIGVIFSWAVFAATVGTVLRIIQENAGFLGRLIAGFAGAVFSVATYFVVPIITNENLGPIAAFKRSAQMMKQKWGESIGAGFSFVFIQFIAIIFWAIISVTIGTLSHPLIGVVIGIIGLLFMIAIISAVRSIFASAVYHNITGDPVEHFSQQFVDNLFAKK
jgi:hypothetical protein